MIRMKKILAFAGSNSSSSINQQFLEALSTKFNVKFELISLLDYEAPLFGIDEKESHGVPNTIYQLHDKMKHADGIVVSAAEHNGSMTAALKSTFDWLSMIDPKFFLSKPTLFLSTSPGNRGGASCLKHLVEIMPYRGAEIIGHYSMPSFHENCTDGVLSALVLEELMPLIRKLEDTINKK